MKSRRSCEVKRNSSTVSWRRIVPATVAAMAVMLACWSCSSTGCTDNRSSLPLAGFYTSGSGSTIALDSIDVGGVGAPGDSLLLAAGETATEVYLPLRSEREAAAFFIAYRYKALDFPELNDTITFGYSALPYFASEECGAMMRYRIKSVTYSRHLLDSVAIVPTDSVITNANIENLRLYFKTSSADNQ
ncbi:hypothetical protein ED352_06215 [Muribaculaceae bacterium Isolate-002 (NCI)]|nr:hypothetical protein ED352_06215 [Muribaculaceae bacterium Isolate-002 (NCI)]